LKFFSKNHIDLFRIDFVVVMNDFVSELGH
jgi:hypothetical protein